MAICTVFGGIEFRSDVDLADKKRTEAVSQLLFTVVYVVQLLVVGAAAVYLLMVVVNLACLHMYCTVSL